MHVFEQVCPTVPLSWRKNSRAPSLAAEHLTLLSVPNSSFPTVEKCPVSCDLLPLCFATSCVLYAVNANTGLLSFERDAVKVVRQNP